MTHALAKRREAARAPRVWCWSDLWHAVRDGRATGPARLSEAGARAALRAAIARARRDGELGAVDEVVEWPGFRRRLQAQIAAWTRAERPPESEPPGGDPARAAQWAIFSRYRAALKALDAEDAAGFAVWASKALRTAPPARLRRLGTVVFLDPAATRAAWRVLEHAHARGRGVHVTLAFEDDEALAEVYAEAARVRRRLLDWGFDEARVEPDVWRPKGLAGIERTLFRSDEYKLERLSETQGLTMIGAPQGEGSALVVAREVRRLLADGVDPEDVFVLFRRWDDESALVLGTLQAWGLPVAAEVGRPLATDPTASALRLAMRLPVEGWQTADLIRLLRNGQVQPPWPEWRRAPNAPAVAAATVQATRVYRGREPLLRALDRLIRADRDPDQVGIARHAPLARDLVATLFERLGAPDRPGLWREQAERLRHLAETLRLGAPGDDGLETLWGALDDQGAVFEGLSRKGRLWPWAEFVREVEALIGDLTIPAPAAAPGTVRLATIDEIAGARAGHILLANLAEATFPDRAAVEPDPTRRPGDEGGDLSFAREMLRFLRVVGSADAGLVLVYPTTDVRGQELLPAGFLDDLARRLGADALATCRTEHRRFDPALIDQPGLAVAPADARVRAVARACLADDRSELIALARAPGHRRALDGTAAALLVAHQRARTKDFDIFDGLLRDPRALHKIRQKFGPDYTFSPSQLESFIFCPFQFFLRYVLKLRPVDEHDELEEDAVERGSRVHRILELLEQWRSQGGMSRLDLAELIIQDETRVELTTDSGVDTGLHEIQRRRLSRTIVRYVRQHEAYEALDPAAPPRPHRFEVVFGHDAEDPASFPSLSIGEGAGAVRLQGKIDRIDLIPAPGRTGFRVIDYKTGTCPSKGEVKEALYLQLPLYALAVERIVLARETAGLHDVGYWGLGGDGYKPIPLDAWPDDQARLEAYVLAVVDQLRRGAFAIDSRKDDCIHRCEYGAVCRIKQVRALGKRRDDAPSLILNIK
ncbi:MAG TPA: PD-(D/E)XK nuclease family protein [Isosphaeraceae bacterium]|nr:PD-(D/E)XK nuclease family protein [Isosphaeraceae bacterium]